MVAMVAGLFRYVLKFIFVISVISCIRVVYFLVWESLHGLWNGGQQSQIHDTKVILLWTLLFNDPKWLLSELGKEPFKHRLCKYNSCTVTNDRSKVKEADMLLFHPRDFKRWPAYRDPRQLYVLVSHECPIRSGSFVKFNNRINLTATYRHDSDVWVPYTIFAPRSHPLASYKPKIDFKRKKKSVVWAVSHCGAGSGRDQYVEELSKYIDVDIYGKCGKLKCPRSKNCKEKFETEYKFYIAFESELCRDYVTEKTYETLPYELVPVVLGGANYSRDTPPHSVINAMDYPAPRDLAVYLKHLINNEEEYNKYFQWKADYEIVTTWGFQTWGMCKLCEFLHEQTSPPTKHIYKNVNNWWTKDACDNSWVPTARKTGNW